MKFFKRKHRENLYGIGFSNGFLGVKLIASATKGKIDKLDFIKKFLKTFVHQKTLSTEWKYTPQKEAIFANHTSDRIK